MDNYLDKRTSLDDGDSNNSNCETHQEIFELNNKESPNGVTNQCDVQSRDDRDELIDCPDIVTDQSVDQSANDELIGHHETQLVETNEANLHKYLIGCKKNPGHKEFIPVGEFSLNHLPEGHHDIDLYEFIMVTADLTVRVDVRMTSLSRPKVWPDTNVPYPFYNRKSTNLRTGSGTIQFVVKFTDGVNDKYRHKDRKKLRNRVKNCKGSDSPSNVWWEFNVSTATHVVFDDIEASHTSLRLFYDSDDSPVVSVDKVSVIDVNIEDDRCLLKCVTCDKNVGNKLMEMWKYYDDVCKKVYDKYEKCRYVDYLTFIVSHPHGCSKQVSVGQCKDKHQVGYDKYNYKLTYTTCTCPGSSGANVNCVEHPNIWLSNHFVHSGSLKSGLNQSGAGWLY